MPEPDSNSSQETILILTPTLAKQTSLTLGQNGFTTKIFDSFSTLCNHMETVLPGAALISEEALAKTTVQKLLQILQRQPTWSDFPLILVTANEENTAAWLKADGVLGKLGNVTLLQAPLRPQSMLNAVQFMLRARRRQYEIRDLIQERERTLQRLELLAGVASQLWFTPKPEEILNETFEKIASHLGVEFYLHYALNEKTGKLDLTAYQGLKSFETKDIRVLDFLQLGFEAKFSSPKLVIHEHISKARPFAWLHSLGAISYATYPIVVKGKVQATFLFGTRKEGAFKPEQLALLETLCNQIAIAMERKRGEEQIREFNQVLEQKVQDRTAALKESNEQMQSFAYSVSHDLRAPIRSINGFSDILQTQYAPQLDDAGRDYIDRIIKSAKYMDSLTQDLLGYSRLSRFEFPLEKLEIETCLNAVLFQMTEEIRQKKAEIKIEKPLPSVLAHSTPLEQILTNLISNALKFSKPDQRPFLRIWATEKNNRVQLFFEDNGIGIAPEHFERIFRIFERLHSPSAFPGTGVGLALVKKAAERMNGTAGVESVPNQGSKFWIELPKAE